MLPQRELEARIKALQKAQANKEPSANIIAILDGLKADVPSEEVLRITKAGMFIGKLRAHNDKAIGRVANEIVAKWKKAVDAEKKARAGGLSASSARPRESASPAGKGASPAPPKSAGPSASREAYTGNPETRKFTTDNVDINRTDSKVRNSCIGVIYNGLAYKSREPTQTILVKAQEVEAAGLKLFNGESSQYRDKMRSLFANLKNPNNGDLRKNVMSGLITPDRFVSMTSKELLSDEQRKQNAALEKENMLKAQVPQEEKSISESLTCSNCKKKMVSYTQAQTRSADEPMTTFCECQNCGKRWKFS